MPSHEYPFRICVTYANLLNNSLYLPSSLRVALGAAVGERIDVVAMDGSERIRADGPLQRNSLISGMYPLFLHFRWLYGTELRARVAGPRTIEIDAGPQKALLERPTLQVQETLGETIASASTGCPDGPERTDTDTMLPEEVPASACCVEGGAVLIRVNRYERSATARAACIARFGPICVVCGFSFEAAYGAIGAGYIHVHHLVPLSLVEESYIVDPVEDLRPVCANCHAAIHRREPPYSIEEIRQALARTGKS